jgi:hypothetical protein
MVNKDSGTGFGSFERTVMVGKTREQKVFHLIEQKNRLAPRTQKPLEHPVAREPFAAARLVESAVVLSHTVEWDADSSGDRLAEFGLARPRAAIEQDVNAPRRLGRGLPQDVLDLVPIGRDVIEVFPPEIHAEWLPRRCSAACALVMEAV